MSLVLTIIYLAMVCVLIFFVGLHILKKDTKVYDKITGGMMLVLLILRLFLIK